MQAVKAKETAHYQDAQKPVDDKIKAKAQAKAQLKTSMEGKAFADLNAQEKDELLKILAIQAGLIEE